LINTFDTRLLKTICRIVKAVFEEPEKKLKKIEIKIKKKKEEGRKDAIVEYLDRRCRFSKMQGLQCKLQKLFLQPLNPIDLDTSRGIPNKGSIFNPRTDKSRVYNLEYVSLNNKMFLFTKPNIA